MNMHKKNYFFSLFTDARVRNKNTDLIFFKILFSYIKIKNMCIRKNKFLFYFFIH